MNAAPNSEPSLQQLEAALARAAREHVAELRRAEEKGAEESQVRAVLARLGFTPQDTVKLVEGAADPALRAKTLGALSEEMARLTRQVRTSSPLYDINRHIGVRRVMRRFFPLSAPPAAERLRRPRRGKDGRPAPRGRRQ